MLCSFCGKTEKDWVKIIAGPKVYICSECVNICQDILESDYDQKRKQVLFPYLENIDKNIDKRISALEKNVATYIKEQREKISESNARLREHEAIVEGYLRNFNMLLEHFMPKGKE